MFGLQVRTWLVLFYVRNSAGVLRVLMALYDLAAVLLPGGPLKVGVFV
jgi:hypothetical protein